MSEEEASLYEAPFAYVLKNVKPLRDKNARDTRRRYWWRHGDGQPAMRAAITNLSRFIVTPEVAKHRIFRWAPGRILPDCKLMVIAKDDDFCFGVLQSRFHEIWSLAKGSWHGAGNDPRYTPSTTFETFPFPDGLAPNISPGERAENVNAQRIGEAARRLNELRDNWLLPANLVRREPEVVPGYPDRLIAINAIAAETLRARTLTNLYNERPVWLKNAHTALDSAVAAAYGWSTEISEDEALSRLAALNLGTNAPALIME